MTSRRAKLGKSSSSASGAPEVGSRPWDVSHLMTLRRSNVFPLGSTTGSDINSWEMGQQRQSGARSVDAWHVMYQEVEGTGSSDLMKLDSEGDIRNGGE
eukprot:CAMPEP_0175073008 /NCGR_PEP_ID=MMETSP0052_2-20121109/20274_1 /TAXON_ID=51329 ORGANISM="Polytomella parva, Strain SAG 63-3" /NCGR_SAMPLE_ID=MMETSP0052_2 /ASSEMBLY_ACC=CAM_ASM_000194 /LENGTH=98 /DNA_ID=CAMNT_0016340671 /DNA_START=213 /DNA_END=510 /DNA_ORIENTATION=-